MGKRSNFDRKDKDFYETWDRRACRQLVNEFSYGETYCDPCCGDGALIENLSNIRPDVKCVWTNELYPENYTLIPNSTHDITARPIIGSFNKYVMNSPWKRHLLHAIIDRLMQDRPVWALIDSNWKETIQQSVANKYNVKTVPALLKNCVKIKSVGRLKWIRDSDHDGKDDQSWYLFDKNFTGQTEFYGR